MKLYCDVLDEINCCSDVTDWIKCCTDIQEEMMHSVNKENLRKLH